MRPGRKPVLVAACEVYLGWLTDDFPERVTEAMGREAEREGLLARLSGEEAEQWQLVERTIESVIAAEQVVEEGGGGEKSGFSFGLIVGVLLGSTVVLGLVAWVVMRVSGKSSGSS